MLHWEAGGGQIGDLGRKKVMRNVPGKASASVGVFTRDPGGPERAR